MKNSTFRLSLVCIGVICALGLGAICIESAPQSHAKPLESSIRESTQTHPVPGHDSKLVELTGELPATPQKHKSDALAAGNSPGIGRMPQDAGLIVTSVPVGGDLIKPVVKINDAGRQVRQRIIHAKFKYPMLAVEEPIHGEPADDNNPYPNGHVADHLLVSIKAGVDESQVQAMADELGLTVRHQIEGSPCFLLSFPVRDFSSLDQARDLLKKRNEVELVDLDSMVHAAAIPNDPNYGQLYNMSKTQAPSAWNITTGSRAVTVAVLDSGIDYNHTDLAANIWSDPGETGLDDQGRDKRSNGEDDDGNGQKDDWRGWNFMGNNNDPMDSYKHGSHCAGTIGAVGNNGIGVAGVCWQVSLVPVKILDDSGSGSSSTVVAGLYYAANSGFDIASMSVGGPYTGSTGSIQAALEYARTKGLLCVASAGNDNVNTDVSPQSPGSHILDNLISVMNTGTTDEKSASSNYGLTTVSLAAPGINILSTVPNNGYELKTGTSMSAPLVAGACALLKSYNPLLTPTEVKQAIMAGVDVVPGLSGLCVSGGRLNVYKSLTIVTGPFPSYISSVFTEAVSVDGNINPGEDAVGTITLSNYTMGPIAGMVGQLSTSDPDVTVINGTMNYGTLNAGQTTSGSGPYRVRLSAGSTPRFVALSLTVTSDTGGTWTFPVGYSCVNSASISGYVRGPTGSAIAGATVSWSGTGSGQVATGADGFYVIPAVDGSYSVTASAFGFVSSSPVPLTVPPYLRQDFTLDFADLTITPNPLSLQVAGGQTVTGQLTLTNTGSLPVTWSIPTTGYRFMTSDQLGGPAYIWNDISATGTQLTAGDDTNLGPFALGFSMPFYGQNFTGIRIASNGFLSFSSTSAGLSYGTLPNANLPENLIAPLMRDLTPNLAGMVHYQQIDGDTFVVQYTNVPRYKYPTMLSTFQVVLKRDGTIIFYYQRTDDPAVGLVGVQNAARNAGLTLTYNQAFLKPGLAVRIQEAKPAWLGFTPTSGTIAVGSSATVTVSGNAAGLATGNYEANIIVDSNDTGTPVQAARVSFAVGAVPPTITAWPTASSLVYGQALSASTLSGGSASVPGTFAFDAPATVLNAGSHNVPVTFTPTDTATASPVSASVTVVVAKATPVITAWPSASSINYGQYLNASTLNGGSASVGGSFAFNDPTLFAGSDAFTFKVNDGINVSDPATVTINSGSPASGPNGAVAADSTSTRTDGYTVVTLSASGGTWMVPSNVSKLEVLIVGGGGGGGSSTGFSNAGGGGGGAGGLVHIPEYPVTAGSEIAYSVGVGGIGGAGGNVAGTNGSNSVFSDLTALGGGGGSGGNMVGKTGGSGGGSRISSVVGGAGQQPSQSGLSGQYGFGWNGGAVSDAAGSSAGGGGGADAVGNGVTGGAGKTVSITGSAVFYAGGGGGGGAQTSTPGTGGTGGGGSGGNNVTDPTAGTPNTGGGGGGGNNSKGGARGGDGIVIIAYTVDNSPPVATPQTVTFQPGIARAITLGGSDPDGDTLEFVILTQPVYGTIDGTPPNVTYTPPALPAAGARAVTVTFTPTDTDNYHSVTSTVSVIVNASTTPYTQWATQYPGHDLSDLSADNDGDGVINLQEYAFGLNPTVQSAGSIHHADGVVTGRGGPGTSFIDRVDGVDILAVFGRRKDYLSAGLVYRVDFSADLANWVTSTATPTVVASDALVEAVTVPYPSTIDAGQGAEKPKFFRVGISMP